MPENYEGTAIDPETFGQLDADTDEDDSLDIEENDDDEIIEETDEPEDSSEDNDASDEEAGQSFNIEGIGTVTADEIREWRNSGLRQSDYTRKTQELAQQREELKDASAIYEYLKAHPYLVDSIKQAERNPQFNQIAPSAEKDAIRGLQYQVQSMKVDSELQSLHERYGDFNEDELFRIATENKTNNLEMVLKSMMYNDKPSTSAIEEAKRQLKAELEQDRDTVSTIVTNKSFKKRNTPKLSKEEKHVAEMMGMTPREYAKWKSV